MKIKKLFNNYIYLIRLQWRIDKWSIVRELLLLLILPLCEIAIVALNADIVSHITENIIVDGFYDSDLYGLIGILLLVTVVNNFISYAFHQMNRFCFIKSNQHLHKLLEKKLYSLSIDCFEDPKTMKSYNMASRIKAERINVDLLMTRNIISSIIKIVSAVAVITAYFPFISLLFLLTFIPSYLLYYYKASKTYSFYKENIENEKLMESYLDVMTNLQVVQEVKLNNSMPFLLKKHHEVFRKLRDKNLKFNMSVNNKGLLLTLPQKIVYYAIYYVFAISVMMLKISIATFTLLTGYLSVINSNISSMLQSFAIAIQGVSRYDDYREFFGRDEERFENKELTDPVEEIKVKNLTYSYSGRDTAALENVSLDIKKGETVAIVGYNGAGKSTLAKLICGFYNKYEGDIFLNGINYKDINNKDLYKKFSYAMQDYCKYPFTIKENITLQNIENIDENRYRNVTECMNLSSITDNLADGDKTPLNKKYDANGTELSGGQWHTVVLSRALYHNGDVLLFDEPTSSLDPLAENSFIKKLLSFEPQKTKIVISHRLAHMDTYDKIFVMDTGHVVQSGKHNDLINDKEGLYFKLWHAQADNYIK